MNVNDIKTERTIIKADGMDLVSMVLPKGFTNTAYVDYSQYNGFNRPYNFTITSISPDQTCQLSYWAPVNYLDNHMVSFNDNMQDDYGNLLHHYASPEDILDSWARSTLVNCQNVRFVRQIDFPENQKKTTEKAQKIRASYAKQFMKTLNWFVHKGMFREYAYSYDGYERRRTFAMTLEATDYSTRAIVPSYIVQPSMSMFAPMNMSAVFPGLSFDGSQYTYLTQSCTSFTLYNLKMIDCLATDYPGLYKAAFLPLNNNAVQECDALKNDYKKRTEALCAHLAKQREMAKQVSKIQSEMRQSRMETQRHISEIQRKTNAEISAMREDTRRKQEESQRRINQGWSDVILGNTRFKDSYGDEHVIHSLNKYAYKRGNEYISSDTPLDLGYDWEELKRKQ